VKTLKLRSRGQVSFGIYDVFAAQPFGGNQACVINGYPLTDRQLLKVAGEFLSPETAHRDGRGDALVLRFANSDRLIPRCGHATLAAVADYCFNFDPKFRALSGSYIVNGKKASWHAKRVATQAIDVVAAWPDLPTFDRNLHPAQVAEAVALDPRDINLSLPLCVYDSGNQNALLPVASAKALGKAKPDPRKLAGLFAREQLTDLHLYFISQYSAAKRRINLLCRNVFPYGVLEEAATGSASVALASAVIKHYAQVGETPRSFAFKQRAGRRIGLIKVVTRSGAGGLSELRLQGRVVRTATGRLWRIPK